MPSNRPNLTLDEQSFQDLLSAAFTIQEHNRRLGNPIPTPPEPEPRTELAASRACPHCGAAKPADTSRCQSCGSDEFRPGERLQRNWASMWLMSQEHGLWPERSAGRRETVSEASEPRPHPAAIHPIQEDLTQVPSAQEDFGPEDFAQADLAQKDFAPEDFAPEDSNLIIESSASDQPFSIDAGEAAPSSMLERFAAVRVKLRFHRADLYLGTSVLVAAIALLWPAASEPGRAALSTWDKALITLGIAEAPAPAAARLPGDPRVEVWVDPHTALYYCPGEDQYGKTPNGRFTSQREAEMDRFEPAERSACE